MRPDNLIEDLAYSWRILAGKYTADVALIRKLFSEIQSSYTADHRHYHDLTHISTLLRLCNQYKEHLDHKDIVDFAIFYHDIAYDVSGSDNEALSAGVAKERLSQLLIPEAEIAAVVDHIFASKKHVMADTKNQIDRGWFLDFDMCILGAEWAIYLQYSQDIRKEYSLYPDIIYNEKRGSFLLETLNRKFIFQTTEFRNRFEQQARENLQRELNLLYTV